MRILTVFLLALSLCSCTIIGAQKPGSNGIVGAWKWEITAHDIDGGGPGGSGAVTISEYEETSSVSGQGVGTWSACEGQCSSDQSGTAKISLLNGSVGLTLEGAPSTADPVGNGWLIASSMSAVSPNVYEGIVQFGICEVGTGCLSSAQITFSKVP